MRGSTLGLTDFCIVSVNSTPTTTATDNTYMDAGGSCDLCMYTGLLDHPEFQFTGSGGGVHDISGWESDWGHYNVNVPLFTYWLRDAEFKELAKEARLHGLGADEIGPWGTVLDAILWSARKPSRGRWLIRRPETARL